MVDLRRYKGRKSGPNWLKLWLKTPATDELATQSMKPVWLHTLCHCPGVTNHPPLPPSYFNASSGDLYTAKDSWLRMQPYGRLNLFKFWYRCIYDCQSDKVIKNCHLERPIKGQNMIVRHVYECDCFTGIIHKMIISKMNTKNGPSSMSW